MDTTAAAATAAAAAVTSPAVTSPAVTSPALPVWRRVPQLVVAFAVLGLGCALTVRADLGLAPWDVLHQGIGERVGLPIGFVGILVGLVVFVAWVPLRERPGVGTVLNVLLIGAFVDLALLVLPDEPSEPVRWAELVVGILLFGPGVAAYLACGLGAGPRDGVMTALAARGRSIRVVRTVMEVSVLVVGFLLGGTVGVGTVLFAFTIGPNVHWCTERFFPVPTSAATRGVTGVRPGATATA